MMYNIKFTYRPIAMGEGVKAAVVEMTVNCNNTSESELSELGVAVNKMIEHILTDIPNNGKLAFAKEACRYMMDNIDTK